MKFTDFKNKTIANGGGSFNLLDELDAKFTPLSSDTFIQDIRDHNYLTASVNTTLLVEDEIVDVKINGVSERIDTRIYDNVLNAVTNILIRIEIIDVNNASMLIRTKSHYASGVVKSFNVTPDFKSKFFNLESYGIICDGVSTIPAIDLSSYISTYTSTAKLDELKDYYLHFKIHKYQIIRHTLSLTQYPYIFNLLGFDKLPANGGKRYLSAEEILKLENLNKSYTDTNKYDLIKLTTPFYDVFFDNKIININNVGVNNIKQINVPQKFVNVDSYLIISIKLKITKCNVDKFWFGHRSDNLLPLNDDSSEVFSKNDVGKTIDFVIVRKWKVATATADFYLRYGNDKVQTFGVNGAGYTGNADVDVELLSYNIYISKEQIPNKYVKNIIESNDIYINSFIDETLEEVNIAGLGDSIMANNWIEYLTPSNPFKYTLYGLRTLVADINQNGGGMCNTYTDINNNPNIIIVEGGTHDWKNNIAIGTFGGATNTLIGAFEKLIKGISEDYPQATLLICGITPRNLPNTDAEFLFGQNTNGNTIAEFNNAIQSVCENEGITFIPNDYGITKYNMCGKNLYIKETITDNSRIDATGTVIADNDYFTTDFIEVDSTKKYMGLGTHLFAEYDNTDAFIRLSGYATSNFTLHPNTTKVKCVALKSVVIVDNTEIGIGSDRYWIGDIAYATATDRIHPNLRGKKQKANLVTKFLDVILSRNKSFEHATNIYTNNNL